MEYLEVGNADVVLPAVLLDVHRVPRHQLNVLGPSCKKNIFRLGQKNVTNDITAINEKVPEIISR